MLEGGSTPWVPRVEEEARLAVGQDGASFQDGLSGGCSLWPPGHYVARPRLGSALPYRVTGVMASLLRWPL